MSGQQSWTLAEALSLGQGIERPFRCSVHEDHNASASVNVLKKVWYCLKGSTRVLTPFGWRRADDVGPATLLDGNGDWVDTELLDLGAQQLWQIALTRDGRTRTLYATAEHEWLVYQRAARAQTQSLVPGTYLETATMPQTQATPDLEWVKRGFVFGDGWQQKGQWYVTAFDSAPEKQVIAKKIFADEKRSNVADGICYRGVYTGQKELPGLDEPDDALAGWLIGYFAADGYVDEKGRAVLSCADPLILEHMQIVSARLGLFTGDVRTHLRQGFGEPSDLSQLAIGMPAEWVLRGNAPQPYLRRRWQIVSVSPTDQVEPVYCAVVPTTHSFVIEGMVLTANCHACGASGRVDSKAAPKPEELLGMLEPEQVSTRLPEAYLEMFDISGWPDAYWHTRFSPAICYVMALGQDPFTGEATFPVYSPRGHFAGVGRRHEEVEQGQTRKFYRYPAGWSASTGLGGLRARSGPTPVVTVVEGYADAAAVWETGAPALCQWGSHLHRPQVEQLARLNPALILLGQDMDDAGRRGADMAYALLAKVAPVRRVHWSGKDPGEGNLAQREAALLEAVRASGYAEEVLPRWRQTRAAHQAAYRKSMEEQ